MMTRRLAIALSTSLLLAGAAAMPARAGDDAALKAAVASPDRGAAHVARDSARNPYESLKFWGLKPGLTVIEVAPGSGYWTEILAPYAKATGGTYVATATDLNNPKVTDGARKARADFEAKFSDAGKWGSIRYAGFGPVSGPLGDANSADIVITARNIHNFMYQDGMLAKSMADFFAVLKPGGVLAVEEHRADPRPEVPGVTDGYVSVATVVAAAEEAGFKLDAQSEVNANPRDTKDHPFGVWTLPPVKRTAPAGQPANPAFDRTKYDAIGESDRMTLRFVKPK